MVSGCIVFVGACRCLRSEQLSLLVCFGLFVEPRSDIVLTCVWALLLLLGIIVQAGLARGREKFPQNLFKQISRKFHRQGSGKKGERRRLLGAYAGSATESLETTYGAVNSYGGITTHHQSGLH